jgi:pimeloyl-ACP methyl ester carboxylesterase
LARLLYRTTVCPPQRKRLILLLIVGRSDYSAQVPLNYSDPDGEKAIIAMTRIPSPLPVESPWYRGPILFNPGGPGGSGVDLIARDGKLLSAVVGPQFDVLGFDPRGVFFIV